MLQNKYMNKRFYILTVLAALGCLLLFTMSSSFKRPKFNIERPNKTNYFGSFSKKTHKNAFATIVCDPLMMEATLVSIYSLTKAQVKSSSAKTDIIVLLHQSSQFNTTDIQDLESLGVQIINVRKP